MLWEPGVLGELPAGMHPVLLGCRSCLLGWAVGRVSVHASPINGSVSLQANSSAQISHPCYPQGYQENITVAELYDSPCVRAPSSASPALVLTVTGTGDPAACGTAVQRLFNFSCGAQWPCGFNGVYQPPVRGQFFVSSSVPAPGGDNGSLGHNPWKTAVGECLSSASPGSWDVPDTRRHTGC